MAEDPFQLFDDSDDENDATADDDLIDNESKRRAILDLVQQTNARTKAAPSLLAPAGEQPRPILSNDARKNDGDECTGEAHGRISGSPPYNDSHLQGSDESIVEIHDVKWTAPEYLGPISLVESGAHIGGGRMLIASRDLLPGTLLLLERPLATWSTEDNNVNVDFVRMVLGSCADVSKLLHDGEDLHPKKSVLDAVDRPKTASDTDQVKLMMQVLESQYEHEKDVADLLNDLAAQNIANADGSPFTRSDLLRFMLVLRYNALETGLYLYTAMLNHSDRPNCVKFKGGEQSEVRATRSIRHGEMLTISYVPTILSHASRRWHLWQQHRFDIGTNLPDDLRPLELVAGSLPPSSVDKNAVGDTVTQRIETTVQELSSHIAELEMAREVNLNVAMALELSSLELCRVADEQLQNQNHLLLLPCLKLHVDACALVQKTSIHASVRVKLLERLVDSAMRLLALQKLYHGPDHFDVARTDLDLAQGISELLSRNPSRLLSLDTGSGKLQSTTQWASYENELRKDYRRIKEAYENR
jgi:hypothetical protein